MFITVLKISMKVNKYFLIKYDIIHYNSININNLFNKINILINEEIYSYMKDGCMCWDLFI